MLPFYKFLYIMRTRTFEYKRYERYIELEEVYEIIKEADEVCRQYGKPVYVKYVIEEEGAK